VNNSNLPLTEHIRLLFGIFILNNPESMHTLGAWYGSGYVKNTSLKKRIKKSFYYYKKAADLGHPESQYDLGFMIISGEISEMNFNEGLSLIEISAQSGFHPAKELLDNIC
jgi:TPR repeat protein